MKKISKILSLILAVVMTMSMTVTAGAASTLQSGVTGSITISNPIDGVDYVAYKIFDVEYYKDGENAATNYCYTISNTSKWLERVQIYASEPSHGMKLTERETTTTTGDDGTSVTTVTKYEVVVTDSFSAADFAKELKNNVLGKTDDAYNLSDDHGDGLMRTDKDTDPDPKNVPPIGYYLVLGASLDASIQRFYQGLAELTTTTPDVVIEDKNEVPFDKQVKASDADDSAYAETLNSEVGKTVNFRISAEVPVTTNYTSYIYIASDKMSEGLTFIPNINVTINDVAVALTRVDNETALTNDTYLLVDKDGNVISKTDTTTVACGFKLSLDMLATDRTAGQKIVIRYDATVNENAVAKISTNEATLTYSNDPDNASKTTTTPPDIVKVYTAKIAINKIDAADNTKKLQGAKFVLYRENGTDKEYYKYDDAAKDISWVTVADGTDLVAAVAAGTITAKETASDGTTSFDGLENGTYYLKEIVAPTTPTGEQYNLLAKPVEIEIAGEPGNETSLTVTKDVENVLGDLMPTTGGMGTRMLYTIGGLFVIVAGVLLITKRRMNSVK